jgi:hypothetical protein
MLRKDIDIDINPEKDFYLIPTIKFSKYGKFFDITFYFLIFYIYISYTIYDTINEDD